MEICSSYRCAVSQQKCSAALVWAKCLSHCSVLLCKTGSQQVCVTYGDLLFIQVCIDPTQNTMQHWSRQNAVTTVFLDPKP